MLSPRSVSREIYARQMRGNSLLGVLSPAPQSAVIVPIEIPPEIPRYRELVAKPSKTTEVNVADAKLSNPSPFKKLLLPGHHGGEPRAAGKAHIGPQSARIEFEQARKQVKSPTVSVRNLANIGEGRSAPVRPSRRLLGPPPQSTVAAMGLSPRGARVRGDQAVGIATRSRESHVINPDDSRIVQSLRAPIGGPEAWANAQRVRISHIFTNEDSEAQSPESDRKAKRLSDSYANSVLGSSRGMATALGGPDMSGIFNRPPSPKRPVGKRIVRGPLSVGQVRVVQPIVPSQGNANPTRGRRIVEGSCKGESWTWSMKPSGRLTATPDLMAGG